MAISTTITKKFFDLKIVDLAETGHFWEFKEFKKFWIKQLDYLVFVHEKLPVKMVFLVGNKPHTFIVTKVWIVKRIDVPEKYNSVISTEKAYALKCVETIEDVAKRNGLKVWYPEEK